MTNMTGRTREQKRPESWNQKSGTPGTNVKFGTTGMITVPIYWEIRDTRKSRKSGEPEKARSQGLQKKQVVSRGVLKSRELGAPEKARSQRRQKKQGDRGATKIWEFRGVRKSRESGASEKARRQGRQKNL
jgi:hypothetical protein